MMFQMKQLMTKKDWAYLAILLIVAVGLWIWVWREFQKPIVDPSWYANSIQVAGHDYKFE